MKNKKKNRTERFTCVCVKYMCTVGKLNIVVVDAHNTLRVVYTLPCAYTASTAVYSKQTNYGTPLFAAHFLFFSANTLRRRRILAIPERRGVELHVCCYTSFAPLPPDILPPLDRIVSSRDE